MTFKKIEWFYIVEINGTSRGTVQKEKNTWQATNGDGWIYTGKTRKAATENMLNGARA